jgi:hypothetical protein
MKTKFAFRYRDSYGIDVWTPGEISLIKRSSLVQAFTGKCKIDTGADSSGVAFLVATDMAPRTSQTTAMYKITSSGTSTALVNLVIISNETILAPHLMAHIMYVATTAGIYDIKLSDGTTHKHYNI